MSGLAHRNRTHVPSRTVASGQLRRQRPHRGAAIIGVLACLLIGTVLIGLTVQTALRGRREAKLERQMTQTQWLCEGGIVRAVAALKKSSDYQGETWQPKLDMEPFHDAVVDIKVQHTDAAEVHVEIIARLDSTTDFDGPMQRSFTFTFKQPKEADTKTEKSE